MATTNNKPDNSARERLVVHVSRAEFSAITKDAERIGLKNAHRWAAMKLAPAIRAAAPAK